jgi:signal transduction histidine kinase
MYHELNQPLQSISGYSKLLLASVSENDAAYPKIKAVKEQVDRIGVITKKLMGITKYRAENDFQGERIADIENRAQRD